MIAPLPLCTNTVRGLLRGAAIAVAVAALGGSCISAPRDTPGEGTSPDPPLRSEFWDKPAPRCLHCHRRDDHRLDPSRRTAYARFTPSPTQLSSEAHDAHIPVFEPGCGKFEMAGSPAWLSRNHFWIAGLVTHNSCAAERRLPPARKNASAISACRTCD
jgi:hypothetical protein